ncbi:hypothetical protein V8C86DRAFT_3131450 [Haematococcus lacustris]
MRTPVQASALLLFLLVMALRTGISAPSFNAITSTSRIAYYREQWAVARHEKERLEKLGLMLDLDTVYKSPPLPGPTAQPLQGVVMPLEADPVEAVLIAVDDVDAKTDDLQATLMWQAIIRTAQRQGILVIAYTVRSDFNTATLAQIKRALASDPDISIEEVSFIEDYQVDSIWMRDYGPLFVFGNVPQAMANASGTSSPQAAAGSLLLREGGAGKLEQQLTLEPQAQVLSAVYFSDRPEDCQLPDDFASRAGLPHTQVPLLFEGGNLLPNGQGICIMSDRVLFVSFRGSDLSLPERLVLVEAALRPYGCTELIVVEALTADITGHVDMWMSWPDAHTLMVGQYTYEQSPWDHVLMQHTIARLQRLSRGRFEVVVMPMPSNCQAVRWPGSDTWQAPETCPDELEPLTRTYLNALYLNDYVVVPVYDEARLQESAALDLWERVAGGRYAGRVVTARADMMIEWSGSIHCMTRAVPRGTLPPDF